MERFGFVGLPNAGKSSLFNALAGGGALAAPYPFATKDPNVGRARVPDHRLDALAEMSKSKNVVPATCEFMDIGGLVAGASQGEGLGRLLKATNALRLLDERPEVRSIITWNAFSNAPMLGINIAMGFEIVNSFAAYQVETAALRSRLG